MKPVTIGDSNNLGLERTTPLIWGLRADGRHCLTLRCCKGSTEIAKEILILKLLFVSGGFYSYSPLTQVRQGLTPKVADSTFLRISLSRTLFRTFSVCDTLLRHRFSVHYTYFFTIQV